MSLILAADIGGTNIRTAVVDADGNMAEDQRSQIDLGDRNVSAEQLIMRLRQYFSEILDTQPHITAIGAGFPGFFLGDSGLLLASPNLPNLHDVPLSRRLTESLGLPVIVQNDALCAAVGESKFGAGRGADNLLHITLGTGIGGGLILNSNPYSGESGMAMEFGHLCVNYTQSARHCGCGGKGCVESYASATAISAMYAQATGEQLDTKTIFERACDTDALAKELFENAGNYLGKAIAEAIKLLDVHTVTISGGLIGAWSLLHPAIMAALNTHLIPPLQGKITVLPSTLDDNAGILGASALARKALNQP